jgi:uncharacterized protein YlxW (UPF0749 family)
VSEPPKRRPTPANLPRGPWRGAPPSPGLAMLAELMNNHLDAGYAAAAERREVEQPPSALIRRFRTMAVALTLVVVGVILAIAYQQAIARAPDAAQAKAGLVDDIKRRSAASDSMQRQADDLREKLAKDREAALADSAAGQQTARQLEQLETITGLSSVTGPGLVVTIGDGPPPVDPVTGEPTGEVDLARVLDRDLQELVNALWRSGAEAITIDNQRLTPTSTIRLAGEAILVDLRPVTSPYEIKAIGDADRLNERFTGSSVARRFRGYIQRYEMTFEVKRDKDLSLPASAGAPLSYAHVLGGAADRDETTPPASGTATPPPASTPPASTGTPTQSVPSPTGGGR